MLMRIYMFILVVAFGLFAPKFLGGGGDLQFVILLEKECSFSGADNVKWWDHSNTTSW